MLLTLFLPSPEPLQRQWRSGRVQPAFSHSVVWHVWATGRKDIRGHECGHQHHVHWLLLLQLDHHTQLPQWRHQPRGEPPASLLHPGQLHPTPAGQSRGTPAGMSDPGPEETALWWEPSDYEWSAPPPVAGEGMTHVTVGRCFKMLPGRQRVGCGHHRASWHLLCHTAKAFCKAWDGPH